MPVIMAGGWAAARSSALSAAPPPITTSWRLPLMPSMMVTVLLLAAWPPAWRRLGLGRARRLAVGACRERLVGSAALLPDRDMGDRLAAERIVVEQGKAGKGQQEQAEQAGERLHRR